MDSDATLKHFYISIYQHYLTVIKLFDLETPITSPDTMCLLNLPKKYAKFAKLSA
ncbi:MAG: hypothetical protein LBL98_02015 [Ruminococcus sp.]|jgi:hypothetical protein|nr:hypothetical protein [Ruminococcus sp.]